MKKLLVRILIALVLVVIAAIVAVALFLDSAVKRGVETVGPRLTKVTVKLDSVSLSLLSGSGTIKGLILGNPEGYKAPQSISVGLATLSLKPTSVFSDKIIVRSIRVEAPEITLEGEIHNNLSKILDNVNAANSGGGKDVSKETAAADKKAGRKLQVDDFVITGAKVHVSATGLTIPLPEIHLTGLGQGPDGITVTDLTRRMLDEIVTSTLKAVSSSAIDIGKGAAGTATKNVGKATKGITDLFKKKP